MNAHSNYILLIDINAPWVRWLMTALPGVQDGTLRLRAWQVYGARYWLANRRRISIGSPSKCGVVEDIVRVPGWTRFARLSTAWLTWKTQRLIRREGKPLAIIYTLPHYATVAAGFMDCYQVYYAYDAYRYYGNGWDPDRISCLEQNILNTCDLAFAVSRQLQKDFQKITPKPVYYLPNAANKTMAFTLSLNTSDTAPPDDIRHLKGPIVGCIGTLSLVGYDWPLIEMLAKTFPQATFVFIGPKRPSNSSPSDVMNRIFDFPNVRWLGLKPHDQLPRYLRFFRVCFSPLAVNEFNNRRSPLRLYDYLCTTSPVLSTAVSEAFEHRDLIAIARNCDECARFLERMLQGDYQVDVTARRAYLDKHIWERRGEQLMECLVNQVCSHSPKSAFGRERVEKHEKTACL